MTLRAAADGSALGNPGPAGWAWYIDDDRWRAGGWPHGTNNMGELKAVLDLLESTAHLSAEPLEILCDSQYVINSVTKWMPGWKKKGWKKSDGKPVLNVDLMKAIDSSLAGRQVRFTWVKGHAGHAMNEAADERARAAATAYQQGREPAIGPGLAGRGGTGLVAEPAGPVAGSRELAHELGGVAAPGGDPSVPGPRSEVIAAERGFLAARTRGTRAAFAEILHASFEEDSDGDARGIDVFLDGVEPVDLDAGRLAVSMVGSNAALVSYSLTEDGARTERSSLWWLTAEGWRLRLHQVRRPS